MLRLVFWSLLFLNAALFAYAQGFLGSAKNERDPVGAKPQINRDKLRLLSSAELEAAKAAPAAATESASGPAEAAKEASTPEQLAPVPVPVPAPAQKAIACIDVGLFTTAESRRFESRLAALDLGAKQSRQSVQSVQDATSYLVNIPPQGSKEAADKKVSELRNLGVTNFFIMQGESPLKWAISLGVFKTESGAQTLLAQLNKQGVHTARITPRGPQSTRYSYRFRDIDVRTRERIVAMADAVSEAQARACE